MFLFDEEIVEFVLLGELIAQSHAVVVDTETDGDAPVGSLLEQVDSQLVVVVADGGGLTPYGFPRLVEGAGLRVGHGEAFHQVGLVVSPAGMFVFCQFKSEPAGFHHVLALVGELVGGTAVTESETEAHVAVR